MIGSIGSNSYAGYLGRAQELARSVGAPGADVEISKMGPAKSADLGAGVSGTSFSNLLEQAVKEVDDKMKVANTDERKLLTGETNNLHQAMISMQESSVAFSLMVEVRNKLVDSYQELMRMQV